jgi:hypothetical protein
MIKFKTKSFPINSLGILKSVIVKAPTGDTVNIDYPDLKLVTQNNQLCYLYRSNDGDIIIPIARKNTIDKLFKEYTNVISNI